MLKNPPLPDLMVAPNGAHKTKTDHPALPVTVSETVAAAKACYDAGADGLHAHVRDADGQHVLDAGLYSELIAEMTKAVPNMAVQITTEAVGRYTPDEQRALVRHVMPDAVSIAVKEMVPDNNTQQAASFYHWAYEAGIQVQHIVYSAEEMAHLLTLVTENVIPAQDLKLLFVLGRYTQGQQSSPDDLQPFLKTLRQANVKTDWAICAFGLAETQCLLEARKLGGKMRIGFENSLHNSNGSIAPDNAARVAELVSHF